MTITILDFAIVAVPLVILLAALLSRVRERLRQQTDEVNGVKAAILQEHIETLRAKANRNLIRSRNSRDGRLSKPRRPLIQAA